MILVTGGAGFIGSNVVHALNAKGENDVVVVDDLTQGDKHRNLQGARIADFLDKEDFYARLARGERLLDGLEAIVHQGACTDTTLHDGRLMMRDNFEASKRVLALALQRRVPLIYASSAAVYGGSKGFSEDPACEAPLNVYGYSKLLFDELVRREKPSVPVVGLRYFNVYGPREAHKGPMASMALHLHRQCLATGELRLFVGSGGYADGEQRRDFVHVDDVVRVVTWFLAHPQQRGIFNVGTGASRSFNDVARAVLAHHGRGKITYVPFPDGLRQHYQSFTEADATRLRAAGYDAPFLDVAEGVAGYLASLAARGPA